MANNKKTDINPIELYFEWWLKEMITAGYIKQFIREPETLIAAPTVKYGRTKRFKRKDNEVEPFNLFPEVKYTYDDIIIWDESAEYLFYEEINEAKVFQFDKPQFVANRALIAFPDQNHNVEEREEIISYVDVKPVNNAMMGGKVTSAISFPLKQRLCWENLDIYINKVIPRPMSGAGYKVALFVKTFTPQRYLITDGGARRRKINFPVLSLDQYVEKKSTHINNLLNNTK